MYYALISNVRFIHLLQKGRLMTANIQYPINEIFESIQGEGSFTGVPSIFIRLQGCPVGCPWCDTQHTWQLVDDDQIPVVQLREKSTDGPTHALMNVTALLTEYETRGYQAKHIVITGGEPAMHDLMPLTEALLTKGFSVQIETSGTFHLHCADDTYVTVSPKIDMPGKYPILPEVMARANEIKHAVAMQKHVDELKLLLVHAPIQANTLIYLQPISQQARATQLAVETCIKENWRLSLQTHKFIGIE